MSMNSTNKLQHVLSPFTNINLKAIDKVKLMRRVDTKYVFEIDKLPAVLKEFYNDYFLVEINGDVVQQYKTVYFDTPNYKFYTEHHNGIKNRYKIRFRTYVKSNLSFFEIKHKTNRKETIKSRLKQSSVNSVLDKDQVQFAHKKTKQIYSELTPSLSNSFRRITLVSKQFDERVTIDTGISVMDLRNNEGNAFEKLCIIETKRDLHVKNNSSARVLQSLRIKPSGFSKYCMGLAFTNPHIKKNLFKPRLTKFNSILN